MSAGLTITISDETTIMRGYFHSEMLNTLLLGIYTPLYFGTMYIFMTGKSSTNRVVVAATTVLYAFNVIGGLKLWEDISLLIGTSGSSMSEGLLAESTAFADNIVWSDVTKFLPFIVADGLLIWRCFKIWNGSYRIVALSLLLFLAEIALYSTVTVFDFSPRQLATGATRNHLLSVGLFTTLAVTLWTTTLIVYRIYSAANDTLNRQKPRFYNILEMITQSSLIYALALGANALLAVIPQRPSDVWTIFTVANYVGVVLYAITGIAPTLMVARIALLSSLTSDTEPTTTGASDIQFGWQNLNAVLEGDASSTIHRCAPSAERRMNQGHAIPARRVSALSASYATRHPTSNVTRRKESEKSVVSHFDERDKILLAPVYAQSRTTMTVANIPFAFWVLLDDGQLRKM
ncbi:hypothetical protein HYPSUDRAFT_205069 [Hypholoma sublateritium FD-334 SS-4]|uniref:Uncharacterized protein n=1 Tax=Hypholoma sublateritium (strain FD-334 SS-4) TaxID=945553 RepID=A0A0D2NQ06_HYPSF|nr:hypothetical protein HYPSUDRAFT_205069 [Hypholoma sublateritium FD-334 SS-4]